MDNHSLLQSEATGSIPVDPTICTHQRIERCLYMAGNWWWVCLACSRTTAIRDYPHHGPFV